MSSLRSAFTLIELLVVIAIIAILAAILFPVFAQAKFAAKKSVSVSNMKQAALAIEMYAGDYDDVAPALMPENPPVNGGNVPYTPFESLLFPYTKSFDIFHAPADNGAITPGATLGKGFDASLENKKRSYNITSRLATQENYDRPVRDYPLRDDNTGISIKNGRSMTSLADAASTISIAEVWPTGPGSIGFSMAGDRGSYLTECDFAKLAGRKVPPTSPGDRVLEACASSWQTFQPTVGYGGLAAYAFADGHAKALGWGQLRKNDYALFKIVKPDATFTP